MVLSTSVDATYSDDGSDASVKQHQQDHDTIHTAVNAAAGGTTGQVWAKTSSGDYDALWTDPKWAGGDSYRSGYYAHGIYVSSTSGTQGLTQDRLFARPFLVVARRAFDRIGVNITVAAGASGVLRMGIYADGGGVPGALIVDAGTVSATATGTVEITIAQTLDPGLYWLALVEQGSATGGTVTAYSAAAIPTSAWSQVATTPPTSLGFTHPYKASVSGALPNPFGALTSATSTPPMVCLRAT